MSDYASFCGTDVSKKTLDAFVLFAGGKAHRRFSNDPKGWRELHRWTVKEAKGEKVHFCMEATGTYGLGLASHLADLGELVSVENPRFVKHFAVAMGFQNKTDKADARAIAEYARVKKPKAWALREPALRELDLLLRRLDDLDGLLNQEGNRLECHGLPASVGASVLRSLTFLREERETVLKEIRRALKAVPEVGAMVRALVPEPGVGELTALRVLSLFGYDPENFDSAEEAAAAAGLNPNRRESGKFVGKTHIGKQGNADLRGALYMPILSAIRANPVLKDLYERLLSRGKPPMVALVACMRKLVMILFGILKRFAWGIPPHYNGKKDRYVDLMGRQKTMRALTR